MIQQKCYIAIDLKSFYASQEAIARELDPMTVNLVVADESRTDKTICLAVSPALKRLGISGRARLFEARQKVKEANALRRSNAPGREFTGKSYDSVALAADPSLEIDFIVAPPRMALYMECSSRIYEMYLKYVAPEDIHVYSIDEVFIDATPYLKAYGLTPKQFARKLIYEVLEATGITATAGIGTNMFLCKVAMDIVAKHIEADQYGVRIAELDEQSFKEKLWTHKPLTDFWRVGPGYARKLHKVGLHTMGDVARCSLGGPNDFHNEELLYKLFGKNAELLIDHAWGYEPCTIGEIKAYRPETNCISSGQVLHEPYSYDRTRIIVREMTELLVLDMVDKGLVTDQLTLTLGYDIENLTDPNIRKQYKGEVTTDHYGRKVPKHAHGTANIHRQTSSTKLIMDAIMDLFDRIADPALLVRRVTLNTARVIPRSSIPKQEQPQQFSFFDDPDTFKREEEDTQLEREHRRQKAMLTIRKKYGKNAILKGVNFMDGATTRERNQQIGGHHE